MREWVPAEDHWRVLAPDYVDLDVLEGYLWERMKSIWTQGPLGKGPGLKNEDNNYNFKEKDEAALTPVTPKNMPIMAINDQNCSWLKLHPLYYMYKRLQKLDF